MKCKHIFQYWYVYLHWQGYSRRLSWTGPLSCLVIFTRGYQLLQKPNFCWQMIIIWSFTDPGWIKALLKVDSCHLHRGIGLASSFVCKYMHTTHNTIFKSCLSSGNSKHQTSTKYLSFRHTHLHHQDWYLNRARRSLHWNASGILFRSSTGLQTHPEASSGGWWEGRRDPGTPSPGAGCILEESDVSLGSEQWGQSDGQRQKKKDKNRVI